MCWIKEKAISIDLNDKIILERSDLEWYQQWAVGTTPLGDFRLMTGPSGDTFRIVWFGSHWHSGPTIDTSGIALLYQIPTLENSWGRYRLIERWTKTGFNFCSILWFKLERTDLLKSQLLWRLRWSPFSVRFLMAAGEWQLRRGGLHTQ